MLNFLQTLKRLTFWLVLGCGGALVFTTVIGGALFNLEGSTVFSWFCAVLLIIFLLSLIIAIVSFIFWFLFATPQAIFALLGAVVLIFAAVFLFVTPSSTPIVDLGEMLKPALEFLNKK